MEINIQTTTKKSITSAKQVESFFKSQGLKVRLGKAFNKTTKGGKPYIGMMAFIDIIGEQGGFINMNRPSIKLWVSKYEKGVAIFNNDNLEVVPLATEDVFAINGVVKNIWYNKAPDSYYQQMVTKSTVEDSGVLKLREVTATISKSNLFSLQKLLDILVDSNEVETETESKEETSGRKVPEASAEDIFPDVEEAELEVGSETEVNF